MRLMVAGIILAVAFGAARTSGEVCNIKVVTDASPDYHDVESMIHSITARWQEPAEKCWAIFYWNHIARRQTMPMNLHGMECTDPIRQFNDYGYTMCSTIAGINCSIWDAMGYPVKFWDVTLHTVPEVQYGGRFYNRAPKSHIDLLHSFDGGQTWQQSYSLDRTDPPWDVIHYETISEVQVLDSIEYTPFDLRIALPDDKVEAGQRM